jgi:hypothetical protein
VVSDYDVTHNNQRESMIAWIILGAVMTASIRVPAKQGITKAEIRAAMLLRPAAMPTQPTVDAPR